MAIPIWVRILAGRAHGQQKLIAGSYGLWAFGIPEIEYAPTELRLEYLVMRAYEISRYLLTSRLPITNGDTIGGDDGSESFRIETLKPGFFTRGEALRLSQLSASSGQPNSSGADRAKTDGPEKGRWSRLTSWMGRR
jgi:hypothetical protein